MAPRCYHSGDSVSGDVPLIFRHHAPLAILAIFLSLVSAPAFAKDRHEDNLQLLGWVENAFLVAPGFELRAKLDTGANTSSLDARVIKRFRQWGRRWVRFSVRDPETGEEVVMVRERERTIGIVQHEGDNDVRPTVKIELCVAGGRHDIEVSLIDRTNFNYPLLLGRRALRRIAVVHPGDTFLSDATCPEDLDRSGILLDPSATDPDERRRKRARSNEDNAEGATRPSKPQEAGGAERGEGAPSDGRDRERERPGA